MRAALAYRLGAGELTERLTIQTASVVPLVVMSITRSGATATVTTPNAHGFSTGEYITHDGAGESEYNVQAAITVTSTTVYTFAVSGSPATPATGVITATFTSDAQGGGRQTWRTLATIWGQVRAGGGSEFIQAQAIGASQNYEATVYYRPDLTPQMRITWTPLRFTAAKTLEIHSVLPHRDEPRRLLTLQLSEVI